ncbi:MAG: NAD(P)/FAD-dependent oxidoreductase [Elusimicrobia bacterium]|nr:NAD(P)/FAD-dependent oxidoreductase [Elusimicrobiota bacterium]
MSRAALPWEAVVVGGGPAGLAAGLQLSRAGVRTVLVERGALGGQARRLSVIENAPGWPGGVSGSRLMSAYVRQARDWGLKTVRGELSALRPGRRAQRLTLADGRRLSALSVVLATGARFKPLKAPGAERLRGLGVEHAAFDEAERWRGGDVAVIGGGEAAVHQAVHLARSARSVTLVARGPLKAHRLLLARLAARPNVDVRRERVLRVEGRERATGLVLSGGERLKVSAVFVLIGAQASPWARFGGRPGVFVAGDARGGLERQVAVAAGDGMAAAMRAQRWLRERP